MQKKENINNIIHSIKDYKVITFDVFDTLIKRDVQSFKDIVHLINIKYKKITGKSLPLYFYRERLHAPKAARRKKGGEQLEVSLDDIYDVLHIKNKELIKKIECEVELSCAYENKFVKEIYNYCVNTGKVVYAISDMYLPSDCINKMLEKCGYHSISKLFVSQEYGCNKASGKLFDMFLRETKNTKDNVVHIGDNYKADISGSERMGIKSVHIMVYNNTLKYKKNVKINSNEKILYKFINNRMPEDKLESIGYEVLGPLLYYFAKWLKKKCLTAENICFCARDGYLIKAAYESICDTANKEKSTYVYVSRKSVQHAYEMIGQQKKLLTEYFIQNTEGKNIVIVDIGWSGRLHNMLKNILKEYKEITGYYLGTFKMFRKNVTDGMSCGFLKLSKYQMAKLYIHAGWIETLFSDTNHGTTEGYIQKPDSSIEPVLSEREFNGQTIQKLQAGALRFVQEWHTSDFSDLNISINSLIKPVFEFSMNPFYEDVKMFWNTEKKANKLGLKEYLNGLKNAHWKGGFLESQEQYMWIGKIYKLVNPFVVMPKV